MPLVILLHFTGPAVPITARMHSTPQRRRLWYSSLCRLGSEVYGRPDLIDEPPLDPLLTPS
eukprot:122795-Prorocentrum_minimum.AAC.1